MFHGPVNPTKCTLPWGATGNDFISRNKKVMQLIRVKAQVLRNNAVFFNNWQEINISVGVKFFFLNHKAFSFLVILFIYFWLCWVLVPMWAFSSFGERGYSLVVVHRILTAVASHVAEHRFGSCGTWA